MLMITPPPSIHVNMAIPTSKLFFSVFPSYPQRRDDDVHQCPQHRDNQPSWHCNNQFPQHRDDQPPYPQHIGTNVPTK